MRLAAIIGPVTYGLVTVATEGNHRLAIVSTGAFFVLGLGCSRRSTWRVASAPRRTGLKPALRRAMK